MVQKQVKYIICLFKKNNNKLYRKNNGVANRRGFVLDIVI